MSNILEWLWSHGGLPLVVGALALFVAWSKDRELSHCRAARIKDAYVSAQLLRGMLQRHGRKPLVSIPAEEESSGIFDVLQVLQKQSSKSVDPDIEKLVREYLSDDDPRSAPTRKPPKAR